MYQYYADLLIITFNVRLIDILNGLPLEENLH